jgi:hypothetical protein
MAGDKKSVPAIAGNLPSKVFDGIILSDAQANKAFASAFFTTAVGAIPGLGKIFEGFAELDRKLRDEKLAMLLQSFQKRFEATDDAVAKLNRLFSSRSGFILARKLVQILDRGDPDQEWIERL